MQTLSGTLDKILSTDGKRQTETVADVKCHVVKVENIRQYLPVPMNTKSDPTLIISDVKSGGSVSDVKSGVLSDVLNTTVSSNDQSREEDSCIGSPLKLEKIADYQLVNDKIIDQDENKTGNEQKKRKKSRLNPLPLSKTRQIISHLTLERFQAPVWCVTFNQSDNQILLGFDTEYTHNVYCAETSQPNKMVSLDDLKEKHTLFYPNEQVIVTAYCQYDLTNLSIEQSPDNLPEDTELTTTASTITVSTDWSDVDTIFSAPTHTAVSRVKMNVVSGQKNSHIYHLYDDLNFLHNLSESMKTGSITWRETITNKSVLDRIKQLLSPISTDGNSDLKEVTESESLESINRLEERTNLDFTDQLWSVLKDCHNYSELLESFQKICEAVNRKTGFHLRVSSTSKNSLSKWIYQQITGSENISVIEFGGLHALFVLVEIGLERLERDYLHAFVYGLSGLLPAETIEGIFKLSSTVQQRIGVLHQLHIVLECAILMYSFIHLALPTIRQNVKLSLDKIIHCSEQQSNYTIHNTQVFETNLPVSSLQQLISRQTPDVWRVDIKSGEQMLTTLNITKDEPVHSLYIPNRCKSATTNDRESEQIYYCIKQESTRIQSF